MDLGRFSLSGGKPQAELSIAATVRETFSLYSENFTVFLVPMLITSLISGALAAALSVYTNLPPRPEIEIRAELTRWIIMYILTVFWAALLSGLISTAANMIAIGAIIKYSSELLEGHKPTFTDALRFSAKKFLPILAASILAGILTVLGAVALMVPGIILYVMFSLSREVIIIENVGPFKGMSRSKALVSHRWLKTLALNLAVGLIGVAVSFFAQSIARPLGNFNWVLTRVIDAFATPLLPIASTVYYYSMLAKEQLRTSTPPQPNL